MMSGRSWSDPVGPTDDTAECGYGGPTFPRLDPDIGHIVPCDESAVFRVHWPTPDVLGRVDLCAWHLARWAHEWPDVADRYRDEFDLDRWLPSRAWIEFQNVPKYLDTKERRYARFGLDQRGCAHYYDPTEQLVVAIDAAHEIDLGPFDFAPDEIGEWLRAVRDDYGRGWAGIDVRAGGDEGGIRA